MLPMIKFKAQRYFARFARKRIIKTNVPIFLHTFDLIFDKSIQS